MTRTFPGEKQGQFPARQFFTKMGFKQVGDNPDFLYYPLKEGFIYRPVMKEEAVYVSQEEDRGRVLFMYGPSSCPFAYVFIKRAEQRIKEIAPQIPFRWIDTSTEPEETKKRGNIEGCIINAKHIESFVLDKEAFRDEVAKALGIQRS